MADQAGFKQSVQAFLCAVPFYSILMDFTAKAQMFGKLFNIHKQCRTSPDLQAQVCWYDACNGLQAPVFTALHVELFTTQQGTPKLASSA